MNDALAPGPITRALSRLDTRVADILLAGLLALVLVTQLLLGDYEGSPALNILSGLALTLPLIWRRRAPLAVVCVFVAVAIVNEALGGTLFTFPETDAADVDPPLFASLVAGMVAFYSLGAYAEDRVAAAGLLAGIAGLWATVIVSDQVDVGSFIWSGGLVAATPWFAGRVARSRGQRFESLAREQEQRTRIALADERTRIARELHDIVAHSVGVIVIQAQGAGRVFDRDPERAREALGSIEQTARTALSEMRRSLGVLRDDGEQAALEPQPGLDDLEPLLTQARAGGLAVDLVVEGERRPLPQSVDLSAYRIVQEALTNTIKHAGPATSKVILRYGEESLELEVADDGRGKALNGAIGRSGHGILGMRERAASHGGSVEAGSAPDGGFRVHATLPLGG